MSQCWKLAVNISFLTSVYILQGRHIYVLNWVQNWTLSSYWLSSYSISCLYPYISCWISQVLEKALHITFSTYTQPKLAYLNWLTKKCLWKKLWESLNCQSAGQSEKEDGFIGTICHQLLGEKWFCITKIVFHSKGEAKKLKCIIFKKIWIFDFQGGFLSWNYRKISSSCRMPCVALECYWAQFLERFR